MAVVVAVRVAVAVFVVVPEGLREDDGVLVRDLLCDGDRGCDREGVRVSDAEDTWERDGVAEGDAVDEGEPEDEGVMLRLPDADGDVACVTDGELEGEGV